MNKSDYDKYYKKGGTYVIPVEVFNDLCDEIERLNNIINEFNKLIENEINESKLEDNYERVDSLEYCLATLKELKGVDKE